MKTLLKIFFVATLALIAMPESYAQSTQKELKKALKAKVDKQSKKDAKAYKKKGWKVMPGGLPLEKQIQMSRYSALEKDEDGHDMYIVASHQAVGGNYTAAKQIAESRARVELAAAINTAVGQKLTENSATTDFGMRDLETITETISASQNLVSAQLQGVSPVLEMYRDNGSSGYETMVTIRINRKQAIDIARQVYRQELMSKSQKLAQELDEVLSK